MTNLYRSASLSNKTRTCTTRFVRAQARREEREAGREAERTKGVILSRSIFTTSIHTHHRTHDDYTNISEPCLSEVVHRKYRRHNSIENGIDRSTDHDSLTPSRRSELVSVELTYYRPTHSLNPGRVNSIATTTSPTSSTSDRCNHPACQLHSPLTCRPRPPLPRPRKPLLLRSRSTSRRPGFNSP